MEDDESLVGLHDSSYTAGLACKDGLMQCVGDTCRSAVQHSWCCDTHFIILNVGVTDILQLRGEFYLE